MGEREGNRECLYWKRDGCLREEISKMSGLDERGICEGGKPWIFVWVG